MRRICVVLTTRGNFAKMKTVMRAVLAHPELDLQLVVGGALLNRQSDVLEVVADEFKIAATLDYMLASETPPAIGASSAMCLLRATDLLTRLTPDVLMVIADRYETLALAQAGLINNCRIAHLEGGEVSGSIDERIRHAVTKLSHYHFASSKEAADRIVKLGEKVESVRAVGSPSFDLMRDSHGVGLRSLQARLARTRGVDLAKPFLVVSQHPVVTEYGEAKMQYDILADAVRAINLPTIWIWPNNDAGAQHLREPLEHLQTESGGAPVVVFAGLPIEEYGAALGRTICLVGNSSSGIRESAFLGTPAVNIGTRQTGRGRGANVTDAPCEAEAIAAVVRNQMAHGRYAPEHRYGDGSAGSNVAQFLAEYWPSLDKTITY
jgi:UDP-hydrolysing UDP-N-acetyl-D-glucosamine 2-epimerase